MSGLKRSTRALLAQTLLLTLLTASVPLPRTPQDDLPAHRSAGTPGPAYLFLSTSTDESLPLAEAARRLGSPRHARGRRLAHDILNQLGVCPVQLLDAVGDWSDGAENSLLIVLPGPPDLETLAYAAGWFGLLAEQKAVLVFTPDRAGPDAVVEFNVPETNLHALRRALDDHGVPCRTLVSTATGARVVVYDPTRSSLSSLSRLATRYGTNLRVLRGTGMVLGAGTRRGARENFLLEIRAYEGRSPRSTYRPATQVGLVHRR